ncbi:MAG: lamin tail domain-containing protein [Euryarchaeota archaeon]|nr:lamin tail domain-containing protein [Euryarchaeota archaeon]
MHYVNVGQGDGTIWQLADGSVIIYDCGDAAQSSTYNPMNRFLREEMGMLPGSTIHALIASHGHQDHVGGCEEILEDYFVSHLYDTWYQGSDAAGSYGEFRTQVQAEGGTLHVLQDDPSIPDDVLFHQGELISMPAAATSAGVKAQILWPPTFQGSSWDRIAESSIVVRLSFGSVDFCFQGDIEADEENELRQLTLATECDVYLGGHHGSDYASSTAWLQKMDPEHAVVSFGENSYGHPTPAAMCRIQAAGAKIYATHRLGDITLETDGTALTVQPAPPETKDYCASGASYWTQASPSPSPTPTSSQPPQTYAVEITHIEADPPGTDGTRYNEEWAELTNTGSSSVTMTGWKLKDNAPSSPAVYNFPSGFELAPGATIKVFTGSGTNSGSELYWGESGFVWNNTGDTGYLYASGNVLVDQYSYG